MFWALCPDCSTAADQSVLYVLHPCLMRLKNALTKFSNYCLAIAAWKAYQYLA